MSKLRCSLFLGIIAAMLGPHGAYAKGDRLNSEKTLQSGETINSPDKRFTINMQADCNLVVYKITGNREHALWNSGTAGKRTQCHADMQSDGNLVLYDGAHRAVWDAKVDGPSRSGRRFAIGWKFRCHARITCSVGSWFGSS